MYFCILLALLYRSYNRCLSFYFNYIFYVCAKGTFTTDLYQLVLLLVRNDSLVYEVSVRGKARDKNMVTLVIKANESNPPGHGMGCRCKVRICVWRDLHGFLLIAPNLAHSAKIRTWRHAIWRITPANKVLIPCSKPVNQP